MEGASPASVAHAAAEPSVSLPEPSLLRRWFPPSAFCERTTAETAARAYLLRSIMFPVDPSRIRRYSLRRQMSAVYMGQYG
jgi:hypothetical protein